MTIADHFSDFLVTILRFLIAVVEHPIQILKDLVFHVYHSSFQFH